MILDKYGDLLDTADLAEIFNVSKKTIYKEIHKGKFGKPYKIGRSYKVPKGYILDNYFNSEYEQISKYDIISSGENVKELSPEC